MLSGDAEVDDEAIQQKLRAGDIAGAVDAVYRRYSRDLRGYLRDQLWSDDAVDDVLADVFKSLMHDLAAFRGEAKLRTWLRTVARHAMIRYLKRDRSRDGRVRSLQPADEARPQPAMRATYREWIRRMYKQLADGDRQVIDLWIEGWSWKEAAQEMDTTEEALRKRFTRILARMKEDE